MSKQTTEEILLDIQGNVSYMRGVLDCRCSEREKRIVKLENKTTWAYVLGFLIAVGDVAYKVFR